MADSETDRLARVIWEYHLLHHKMEKADCLFVLGSHDIRVAEYAARLFLEGWAPAILFSGGMAHSGDMLDTGWNRSEAEFFADRAIELGVPADKILMETRALNTGENVTFSEKILKEEGVPYDSVIAVQKPYMERRTYATVRVHWPDRKLIVTSPPLSYDSYPNDRISRDELIHIMVGDLQRIIEYPRLGYQIEQQVPGKVISAYERLIGQGYTKHLIRR